TASRGGTLLLALFRDDRHSRRASRHRHRRHRRRRCARRAQGIRGAVTAVDRDGRALLALRGYRVDFHLPVPLPHRPLMKALALRSHLLVWLALLSLLALTAGSSLLPLGRFNLVSNLAIAVAK